MTLFYFQVRPKPCNGYSSRYESLHLILQVRITYLHLLHMKIRQFKNGGKICAKIKRIFYASVSVSLWSRSPVSIDIFSTLVNTLRKSQPNLREIKTVVRFGASQLKRRRR